MYGIDISNYQKDIDLSKGIYDFAIIKATEGNGFVDKSFKKFAKQLTELNKLIGCYHFSRPDLNDTVSEIELEADWFIKNVENVGLLNKAILVIDWEQDPMDNELLLESLVNRIEDRTGIIPFIYMSISKLNEFKNWKILSKCPIYMAYWRTLSTNVAGTDIYSEFPLININWKIWQYTSNGVYPNLNCNIDLDYSRMDKKTWEEAAKPITKIDELISDDMKWAIDNFIIEPYPDGSYRPTNNITREDFATLIRKYTREFIL